jgi:hypothetical protein
MSEITPCRCGGIYLPVLDSGVGKVYVTGFTDDCSHYRVRSKVYLYKDAASAVNALQWALRNGRISIVQSRISKTRYQTDLRPSVSYTWTYHTRGRCKIERYHKIFYRELIALKQFHALSHFRRELWNFDRRYNNWCNQEILEWMTRASVYNNESNFNKNRKSPTSGHQQNEQ